MPDLKILGRFDSDEPDERALTERLMTVSLPFDGVVGGELSATLFKSTDVEDRGGIVLQITLRNDYSAMTPYVRNIDGGVELHMAGDLESATLMRALETLVTAWRGR